jgi:serine/threonine-protein kinase RsbW
MTHTSPQEAAESGGSAWRKALDLPSERGASRLIMDELLDRLGEHGWPSADIFSIHLAAEEAIVNAIVHGNKLAADKKVHVECFVSPTVARIEITDEGEGFDPSQVPDCTREDRLDVPSGRGVMLIHNFMTRVEYNERGNRVLMEKTRDS